MKILLINVVCGIKSTGRICTDLADALQAQGHEVRIAYGRERVPEAYEKIAYRIGTDFDVNMHAVKARAADGCGFGSRSATKRFLEWVERYDPDVIHLHVLHGYYLKIELLFDYLRTCGKKILWTQHDCWAFTGHAAYCEAANCEKWTDGCSACPKLDDYPKSFVDHSRSNWAKKRELMSGIPNLRIVTPSEWLAGLVRRSFLGQYPVSVIYNGVDTGVFRPTESGLRAALGLEGFRVILGVASVWDARKGLRDFLKLHERLDSSRDRIVLVGLSQEQIDQLPEGILGIARTDSAAQLAELYSMADVFVNPTYEDNYPTTNLEAIACGTPVITYRTGGSPESARLYGAAVEQGDVDGIVGLLDGVSAREKPNAHSLDASHMIQQYLKEFRR